VLAQRDTREGVECVDADLLVRHTRLVQQSFFSFSLISVVPIVRAQRTAWCEAFATGTWLRPLLVSSSAKQLLPLLVSSSANPTNRDSNGIPVAMEHSSWAQQHHQREQPRRKACCRSRTYTRVRTYVRTYTYVHTRVRTNITLSQNDLKYKHSGATGTRTSMHACSSSRFWNEIMLVVHVYSYRRPCSLDCL
jgi:hypothetical protein